MGAGSVRAHECARLRPRPLLELIFAVTLPAIGSAILFNLESSSGGTDIVAMILRKFTSLNIGISLLIGDFLITLMALTAFGVETGLFSILGLLIKAVVVDLVLENIKVHKSFQIITSKPEAILRFIVEELQRGATELHGEGAFTPSRQDDHPDGGQPHAGCKAAPLHQGYRPA